MTADREQTRRDALLAGRSDDRLVAQLLDMLDQTEAELDQTEAELAQAERKSENDAACIASLRAETVHAQRERDGLVEAIKGLLSAADEAPDDWMYEAEELQACRDALAAYEQEAAHYARGNATEERTG